MEPPLSRGQIIHLLQVRYGLSDEYVGERAGIGARQIRKYKADEQSWTAPVGVLLAQVFSVSMDQLAGLVPLDLDISGRWFAAWDTVRGGRRILDKHWLVATQAGNTVSLDAAEGSYPWRGTLLLGAGDLRGSYKAMQSGQAGAMFFVVEADELLTGRWIGSTEDSSLDGGYGVLARTEKQANTTIKALIARG